MKVVNKVTLVPDLYGRITCKDCSGYGWTHGYGLERDECEPCKGNGFFAEKEDIVPVAEGEVEEHRIIFDFFGKLIHRGCGGGIHFWTGSGCDWRCASCKEWGYLSEGDRKIFATYREPLSTLANAKGAELLAQLRSTATV
jgi:hypothetical protein